MGKQPLVWNCIPTTARSAGFQLSSGRRCKPGGRWHPACLSPERNQRAIRTPSKWHACQPIHGGSVGRWRRYAPWLGALAAVAPMALDPDNAVAAQ
jgi:hypothetical protein